MQNLKISLIIPAYNEGAIIENTVKATLEFLERSFSEYQLIIADDGSTDDTRARVQAIDCPRLSVVSHMPNRGKGAAVRQGMLAADGEILVYTDADLAYGLEVILPLTERLCSTGADAVIGSRKLHPDGYADYPPLRLFASHCFSFLTGILSGFHYDTQCGIKCFKAQAAREVFSRLETEGFAFDFELMMLCQKLGLSIDQQPVKIINHRESSVNVLRDSLRMFRDLLKIRCSVNRRMKLEK